MQTDIQELKELVKDLILSQQETSLLFKEKDAKFKASREELDQRFKEKEATFRASRE